MVEDETTLFLKALLAYEAAIETASPGTDAEDCRDLCRSVTKSARAMHEAAMAGNDAEFDSLAYAMNRTVTDSYCRQPPAYQQLSKELHRLYEMRYARKPKD